MSGKISEFFKVDSQVLSVTSAVGATSIPFDMQNFDSALLLVSFAGDGAAVIDLMQSTAATAAGSSAAGGKVGISIGSSVSTAFGATVGVKAMTLTFTSASTTDQYVTLSAGTVSRKLTYTTSTANLNSSAWNSTGTLYFGSTLGSTVNTGISLTLESLKTALDHVKGFGGVFAYSTPSTDSIKITALDSAPGGLGLTATAIFTNVINQSMGAFDINADQLTSGNRYLAIKVSTATTGVSVTITAISGGGRYLPPAGAKFKLSS